MKEYNNFEEKFNNFFRFILCITKKPGAESPGFFY